MQLKKMLLQLLLWGGGKGALDGYVMVQGSVAHINCTNSAIFGGNSTIYNALSYEIPNRTVKFYRTTNLHKKK